MPVIRFLLILLAWLLLSMPAIPSEVTAEKFLRQVTDELLIAPVNGALDALDQQDMYLRRYLELGDPQDLARARTAFASLVSGWKTVQTIYIAGALDEEYLDYPQLIDHFHQGNESIADMLDQIMASQLELQTAMFKSSSKSINALEYLLFADIADTARRWQAALISVDYLRSQLAEIAAFYRDQRGLARADLVAVEMIINALVDSSYRLNSWRIGEAAGLTDKYRGQPSQLRLEYGLSGLSMTAIEAIIETHARVFAIGAETGYLSETGRAQGLAEIAFTVECIEAALQAARALAGLASVDVQSTEFTELYARTEALHKAYYFLLVRAMNLQGKIVDADGD